MIQDVSFKATPGMVFSTLTLIPDPYRDSKEQKQDTPLRAPHPGSAAQAFSAVLMGGRLLCEQAHTAPT